MTLMQINLSANGEQNPVAIFIAIVAILMVFGSVMWLKPSAAQQRQTRMRLRARELGLDVRLASIPQTRRDRVREERPEQGVVYRLLQFGDKKNRLERDYVWCRDSANSEWEIEKVDGLPSLLRTQVEAVFGDLPADARAIELTPNGPGVYWLERGDEDSVRRLHDTLVRLQQLLLQE